MHYLIPPWKHQLRGIEFARTEPNVALFYEMGTGKTGTAINILREHFVKEHRVMRTLVLGPIITVKNWEKEFKIHSKIPGRDIVMLVGSGARRITEFKANVIDPTRDTMTMGKVIITNYEALENERLLELLTLWQPEILICDESHRLKNAQGVRAKAVVSLLGEEAILGTKQYTRKVKHVYILTGTPILNSAMDIFQQFRILDSGDTFGTNFYAFRGRYFEDLNTGMPSQRHFPKWIPRQETYEELNQKIYSKALRVLKKDCLDLPALTREEISVELGAEQKRLYNEMKRDYITWVTSQENSSEPRAVVAQMALTKALRLQQIVSGFVKTEDGKEITLSDNPRLRVLKELLEELTPSHKVIVWATFHHNYKQIAKVCADLGVKYVELHGEISAKDKNENVESFRRDPSCRVIIANQGAGGIGINLTEYAVGEGQASYAIFYSKNFSLEHDLQAEARNHRGGAENYESVTRIDLVAHDTIDELISQALATKQQIAELVLGWKDSL